MKFVEMEQRSQEWLDWRKSKIGASEIPIILGESPYCTPYVLWQKKLGFIENNSDNFAMKRGRDLESIVLSMVNEKLKANFVPATIVHDEFEWASASLDGIDLEKMLILEIKCPNKDDHELASNGKVPKHYFPQVQWQLFVSGIHKGFYASYNSGDLQVVSVEYDEEYIVNQVMPKACEFLVCIRELIAPALSENDYVQMVSDEFAHCAEEWKTAENMAKVYTEKEKYYKNKLIELSDDSNCQGYGIKLQRVNREGSVDWKDLWENIIDAFPEVSEKFSPESFKKQGIGYWKISKLKE